MLRVIETVPRPRALVIEEGRLAGCLWRELHGAVARLVVSQPRRNRLISDEGDKDAPLDAEKLAQLLRGGFVKEVQQVESLERAVFKQQVAVYHFRVRQRVREGLRLSALFRQHGVMIREKAYVASANRPALRARLPDNASLRERRWRCCGTLTMSSWHRKRAGGNRSHLKGHRRQSPAGTAACRLHFSKHRGTWSILLTASDCKVR
jgi:hypothetical protein